MAPFSRLLMALQDVPDPRRAQGKRYPLPHLLLFTVLALLSGARSYRGIITFLEHRRAHLNHHFGADLKRAPAVNTLRTVLQSLETEAHLSDRKAAQTLTAFACEPAIVLAHTEIDEKSNEIPAAEQMIRELGLTGVVYTADAMHCQKNL